MLTKILYALVGVVMMLYTSSLIAQNQQSPYDVELMTRNRIYAGNGSTIDREQDTLLLENGTKLVLKQTPLIYFDGYSKLFSDYDVIVFMEVGQKGYTCTWVLKDEKLFLKEINFNNTVGAVESAIRLPSNEVMKERLEALTGEKINSDELLSANWMSGSFGCYGVRPHSIEPMRYSIDWDKEYSFYFSKGEIKSIKRVKKELEEVFATENK